jgi:hypothetical protein
VILQAVKILKQQHSSVVVSFIVWLALGIELACAR